MVQAQIISAAGQPEVVPLQSWTWTATLPGGLPSFFAAEPRLLTKNTSIVDHSGSFFVESAPSHEIRTSYHYTALEVLFGWDATFIQIYEYKVASDMRCPLAITCFRPL